MTPEIIARVDAWLASREAWINSQQHRMGLRHTWTIISEALTTWRTHGPQTKCYEVVGYDECGAVTALTGILLGLVREAWGDSHMSASRRRHIRNSDNRVWHLNSTTGPCSCRGGHWYGATEIEALGAALEASP